MKKFLLNKITKKRKQNKIKEKALDFFKYDFSNN